MKKYLLPLLAVAFTATHCTKEVEKIIVQEKVTQGSMILSGRGVPSAEKGQKGDYYLDLSSSELYGPKTKEGWGKSVLNLKGVKGDKGEKGDKGQKGITPTISEDGYWVVNGQKTNIVAVNKPHIGKNGNWWIGKEDLKVKAQGERGQNGRTPVLTIIEGYWAIDGVKTTTKAQGERGQDGRTPVFSIIDGYWAIDGVKTSTKAQGDKGQDGHTPVVTIKDGYWAIDGVKTTTKAQGEQGTPGQNGADGSKILAENRAPQASDGVVGDYFIDKDAKIFYGPKTASGWPTTGISLTGAPRATVDYELSEDGKILVKWLNPKTSYIDMNLDPNLRNVTTIATGAFAAVPELRDRLSTIVIGDDVTEIQISAFAGCGALRRVELPEGLTAIADFTFLNCGSLQYINIPETVTSIGNQAFANCVKLKKITIPKGVGRFESRTFMNCTALKTLVLENPTAFNIDQVPSAFEGTTLTSIFVPHAAKQAYKDTNRADRKAIIKSVVIE